MKHLFSRSLILFASTLVSLFIATQSAWGADPVVWDFTKESASEFTQGESYKFTAPDGVSEMTYTAGKSDAIERKNSVSYLKQNGASSGTQRDFELKVKGKGKIKIETITNKGEWNIYDGSSTGTLLVENYVGFLSGDTEAETIELTVNTSLYFTTTTKTDVTSINT